MTQTQGIRMKYPAHPGGFVKTEIIKPLGLSVTAAAQVLDEMFLPGPFGSP